MPPFSITRSRAPVSREAHPATSPAAAATPPSRKRRRVNIACRLSSAPMNLTRREWLTALAGVYAIGQIPAMGPPHDDLVALDAGDAIARIASRGVSAIELTEAYLQRIETLNPSIG